MERVKVLVHLVHRSRVMYGSEQYYFVYKELASDFISSLEKVIEELLLHTPQGYCKDTKEIANCLIKGDNYWGFMMCDALKVDGKVFVDTNVFDVLEYNG